MKLNLSGLGAGTYRLMAVGYDTCGNASEPAYGDEFSLDGTETGYPLLTGLSATGTSTGVTVDASALAFSDAAIAQIWEKVRELNGAYNAPTTEEQLRAALNDLLKTQNVRYLLTYYTYGTSPVTQQRNVPANAEDWNYTFPVGLTFSSG